MKRHAFLAIVLLAIATTALASWYDDYNEGVKAVATGRWQVVIQKMTAAIAGNSKENDNARTYGNIFINYHPYYYRGIAYLRTGKYEQAISDLEKTSGPGESDQGSIVNLTVGGAQSVHLAQLQYQFYRVALSAGAATTCDTTAVWNFHPVEDSADASVQ